MTTLYMVDVRGQVRVWDIEIQGYTLVMNHGVMHGSFQEKTEFIKEGKGGRTRDEQVKSRYYSRINDMYKKGYKDSLEEAKKNVGTNNLGLHKPMLAKPYKSVATIDFETAFLQYKYDGHRCLITKQGGKIFAYSRQGKIIDSIEHITDELDLQEGQTLDGELYCHGATLQSITSWIKRKQESTLNLRYLAYDTVSQEPFALRYRLLSEIAENAANTLLAPTVPAQNSDHTFDFFRNSRVLGYEGAIVRWGEEGYEVGKRTKHLVKIKQFFDEEFEVVDIKQSVDGWAVLVCDAGQGRLFGVTAPGSVMEKTHIWETRGNHIGKHVTVEYANLTKDGIPFHPVAIRWREDV